jgi:hypothetical protein
MEVLFKPSAWIDLAFGLNQLIDIIPLSEYFQISLGPEGPAGQFRTKSQT